MRYEADEFDVSGSDLSWVLPIGVRPHTEPASPPQPGVSGLAYRFNTIYLRLLI